QRCEIGDINSARQISLVEVQSRFTFQVLTRAYDDNFPFPGGDLSFVSGSVTSDPSGLDCRRQGGQDNQFDCAEEYAGGTVLTLTATPDPGSAASLRANGCDVGPGPKGQPVSCQTTVGIGTSASADFFDA